MATIDLGKIKLVWKGTYNNSTAYTVDDLVEYTDTGIIVSGIITCTEISGINALNISGVSTFAGITTNTGTLFANQLNVAGVSTFNNNVDISNLKNNFAYDGNDDDIDLLFAETSNVDEEGIIQDAGMFLGSLNVNNNDNTNINVHNTTTTIIDDNDTTVHVNQLGGGLDKALTRDYSELVKRFNKYLDNNIIDPDVL